MKRIALLGSTGSIGTQSLDVCRMHGYRVVCLTANRRVDLMETQIREFRPDLVCMMDPVAADDLRTRVADTGTKVLTKKKQKCAPVWKACFVLLWWMKPTLC